jgi:hypothetical protein
LVGIGGYCQIQYTFWFARDFDGNAIVEELTEGGVEFRNGRATCETFDFYSYFTSFFFSGDRFFGCKIDLDISNTIT